MIWIVLVTLAGGALLAWALDREAQRTARRRTVTVFLTIDVQPFIDALNRAAREMAALARDLDNPKETE